jgi:hypothetical protein
MRVRALELLTALSTENPLLGKECGWRQATGNLFDCRKLYFDEREDVEPRYRIVYRLLPDEDAPTRIQVLAIGLKIDQRDRAYIYELVGRRLGRGGRVRAADREGDG